MIALNNVTYGYKKKKKLFEDFSISIGEGKVCGLLGKNGTGKSTLLHLMTGLLISQKGEVSFKGENVAKRLPSTLRDIFLVPEEFELPHISLDKYVKYNSPFYPQFSNDDMEKYLDCFDMLGDGEINLGALSMGQKKKVFMSFALATNTSLLVMDEPTNGLDIPSKSQFRKFIASGMNDEKTIVISTHQVQDVNNLLEQIIIMDDSNVLLNESVNRISETLCFVESTDGYRVEDAIYSIPSLQGHSLVLANDGAEETPINLEVLFQATLSRKEEITSLFNKTEKLISYE